MFDAFPTLTPHRCRRILPVVLTVAVCVVGVAACGSSGKPITAATSGSTSQVGYANCMRSNGVSNFPDPVPGGGFDLGPQSGIDSSSPAYVAAAKVCTKLEGAESTPPSPSESQRVAMVAFAKCLRAHGISNFADPTFSSGGVAPGAPGASVPLPVDMYSVAFQHAAKACAKLKSAAHGGR